jgi:thiol-disulfide isomerase/thioredoxin
LKKSLTYFFYFSLICFSATSQTINLEFPYFVGQTYEFTIFQGDKRVKIKEDIIPKGGKVQLTIPENYKGYKGIAQWYLTNSASGGGLDLIVNNEDFSVICKDSIPSIHNIIYINTQENNFDKFNYQKQEQLFQKHDALLATKLAYEPKSKFYKIVSEEYKRIVKHYDTYSNDLLKSTLYAAKFRQIVNLTNGIGTIITLDEIEKANNIDNFITNELDFEVLYTSNHWGGIINNWVQLHLVVLKDDAKMITNATTILNRIKSNQVYTDFVYNLTKELTKMGKDDVLFSLIPIIKSLNKLLNYEGELNIYLQELSGKAPDLTILIYNSIKGTKSQVKSVIKTDDLQSKFTLLVFYQSSCGSCEETIIGLIENYNEIVNKGFRIISIAADTDEKIFKDSSLRFPWNDKYCDFKGVKGVNFKNYAVLGTPTMYVLDNKGVILVKIATIFNFLDFMKQN